MLTSRQLGDPAIGILECPSCAGLWLASEQFKLLLDRFRAMSAVTETAIYVDTQSYQARNRVSQNGPLYRACPECSKLMHRRNFGRKSGIIVDHCGEHGYWFDAEELDGVLRWIQQGGEHKVGQLADEEERQASREEKLGRQLEPTDSDWMSSHSQPRGLVEILGWLVSRVLVR